MQVMVDNPSAPSFGVTAEARHGSDSVSLPAPMILVVDDEPPLLRLLEFLLVRQGYTVRTAANGEEALEIVHQERPSLIVLDVMMPRMDGYQVAATIRSEPAISGTPIVMLTARAQDEDQERGREVGVDTYITKPFDPDYLSDVIAGYLQSFPKNPDNLESKNL